jgi:hypothetical protein
MFGPLQVAILPLPLITVHTNKEHVLFDQQFSLQHCKLEMNLVHTITYV